MQKQYNDPRAGQDHRLNAGWRHYAQRLREHRAEGTRERLARLLERAVAELERIRMRGAA